MAEDLGDRTEEATPKRLADAREEGRVAKSADAAGAMLLLGVTIVLWYGMRPMLEGMATFLETALGVPPVQTPIGVESIREISAQALGFAARYGLPILALAWIIGYTAHFWQVGWLFVPGQLRPKFSKLDPIAGFKRIFGLSAVVKAGMDFAKVAAVFVVVIWSIVDAIDEILLMPHLEMMAALLKIGDLMFILALRVLTVLIVLGLLDFSYQKIKFRRDLRMTRTEIKEEFKQSEGDPETRKRRMRMQQQIALQRIGAAVPKADVIITNPEHIAIAIQYEESSMRAPRVVAKGADHVAIRIRQIGLKHGIPIVERKPLARALYRSVEVGQEIPPDFYQAVAEILAYVYRLSGRMPVRGVTMN